MTNNACAYIANCRGFGHDRGRCAINSEPAAAGQATTGNKRDDQSPALRQTVKIIVEPGADSQAAIADRIRNYKAARIAARRNRVVR